MILNAKLIYVSGYVSVLEATPGIVDRTHRRQIGELTFERGHISKLLEPPIVRVEVRRALDLEVQHIRVLLVLAHEAMVVGYRDASSGWHFSIRISYM
jgi:hypothetical protein